MVSSGDRRYVRYSGLSPGDYVFRVRAASIRSSWPLQEIALAVSIAPPWWQRWWFSFSSVSHLLYSWPPSIAAKSHG